jgi:hypothetical protein
MMGAEPQKETPKEIWFIVLWDKFRAELLARPVFHFAMVVMTVLLAGLFYWPIRITRNGKLTDLEQILFQLFLVALPAAISWSIAKRKEEQNVLAKQKALARSAVRRISNIADAAARLNQVTDARKGAVMSGPEWSDIDGVRKKLLYELFDALSKQVVEIRDNIAASQDDWRDILPEEFAQREAAQREILKERELALEETQKAYSELQAAFQKGEARTTDQIKAFNNLIAKQIQSVEQRLSIKVEQIRSQLQPSVLSTHSAVTPSFLNNLTPWVSGVVPGILPKWS